MTRPATRALATVLSLLALSGAGVPIARAEKARDGRIAFRRYLNDAQTQGAVFTIEPDGGSMRQVTHPRPGAVTDEPEWSPNGRWIAFMREDNHGNSRLFKIRPNGTNRTYLSIGCGRLCGDGYASWFPGGQRLAFTRGACGTGRAVLFAIYVMRADGSKARRVTHKDATCDERHRYEDSAPAVSPDGNRIAFERIDQKRGRVAIFTIRLDGSGRKRITPWRLDASQPSWSPGRRWIGFRTQKFSETKGNIGLVHPGGSDLHLITHANGSHKWLSLAFSPSGKHIVAGRAPSGESDNADVFMIDKTGNILGNVTDSPEWWESAPDWGPRV